MPSVNGRFNFGIQGKKGISTLNKYTAKRPQTVCGSGRTMDDDDNDDDDDDDDDDDHDDDDDDDDG